MCGCGGSTPAPAGGPAMSPALVGVTTPRLAVALAPAADPETRFLRADPFPWWLAVLVLGGFLALGGPSK